MVYSQNLQEASTPDPDITRSKIAASSRPKSLIVSTLKKKEKEETTGKPYKATKCESMEMKYINWKSPVFWPTINQVVQKHNKGVGKPSVRAVIRDLQESDDRFKFLTHQRLSDWCDKSQQDKIIWSKKTLAEVEKGFLPGGNQTRFNVFVSFHA